MMECSLQVEKLNFDGNRECAIILIVLKARYMSRFRGEEDKVLF